MGTKTISIMDDAYEILARQKKPNERFSEEIRRLVPKKGNIMECAGLWADISDEQAKQMEEAIKKSRQYTRKHVMEKLK